VDEEMSLRRYGLRPSEGELDEIRQLLRAQTLLEREAQGDGDTELMRLCCVQLFNAGGLDDILTIWEAKESSWDAHCSIECQLLCGAGLERTKEHLASLGSDNAAAALAYLRGREADGSFTDFSVEVQSGWYTEYYLGSASGPH
jgi:hypothetical protein